MDGLHFSVGSGVFSLEVYKEKLSAWGARVHYMFLLSLPSKDPIAVFFQSQREGKRESGNPGVLDSSFNLVAD